MMSHTISRVHSLEEFAVLLRTELCVLLMSSRLASNLILSSIIVVLSEDFNKSSPKKVLSDYLRASVPQSSDISFRVIFIFILVFRLISIVVGWFKFGGVEYFKIFFSNTLGEQKAWDNRNSIYLASSAIAEFIADIFLCPLEATRIRLVSNPSFASGLVSGAGRLLKEEGLIKGFYSGFGPILFKQVPYTMAKFAVQGAAAEWIATNVVGKELPTLTGGTKLSVALGSGVIAGVAAAIISHPADTLLSKVNKAGAGGDGSIATRLFKIANEIGFVKLATVGLGARCVMIGTLTAGQFLLFDIVMDLTGAQKFHFHNPADKH